MDFQVSVYGIVIRLFSGASFKNHGISIKLTCCEFCVILTGGT